MKAETLNSIVESIRAVNESRTDGTTIGDDVSNEIITAILWAYGISDNPESIEINLGANAVDIIRNAEAGCY